MLERVLVIAECIELRAKAKSMLYHDFLNNDKNLR